VTLPLENLPIDRVLGELFARLRERGVGVLIAPTGSGKTTRVAPGLLAHTAGEVWLLEPRRLATRAAAARIAAERGVRLGEEVGYQVRFERVTSRATRLVVATTGIFLRRLVADPMLEGIAWVLFDEVHERSLELDLCLALARATRRDLRPDLGLLAMSATVDPGPLAEFFGDAPVVRAEGRSFPVSLTYRPGFGGEQLGASLKRVLEERPADERGDVLVFLPGTGEIRAAAKDLEGLAGRLGYQIFELYGDLPPEQQDRVFLPGPKPKLILSTNVAESSLTLPNVTLVIDSGLERRAAVDAETGLERLELGRIALDSAEQRRGRAGRVAPGRCVRLWSEQEERGFAPRGEPEIRRANLSRAVLDLYAWGEPDPAKFGWFEAPRAEALEAAQRELVGLGALRQGRLTPLGQRLLDLPLSPRLGRLLIAGAEAGVAERAALAAALLSERDPLRAAPYNVASDPVESDVLLRIEALEAFEDRAGAAAGLPEVHAGAARGLLRARDQLLSAAGLSGNRGNRGARAAQTSLDRDQALLWALFQAFPDRLAKRREPGSARARLYGGQGLELSPRSRVRHAPLFLALAVDTERRRGGDVSCHLASAVELEWLEAEDFHEELEARFDAERGRAVGVRRRYWRELLLEEQEHGGLPQERAEAVLLEAALADPRRALDLEREELARELARLRWLGERRPDLELPRFEGADWARYLPDLVVGRRSFEELKRLDLLEWLPNWLTPAQRAALEREAPAELRVPSGSRLRVQYTPGKAPVLAARIQELFGLAETPRVLSGQQGVLLHLLAPNGRPQQVTEDLKSFWNGAYHTIRKELARRYPRHSWPEDPWTAEAQRRPRPRES
jgi:ATP-dependent helicase HrpB